MTVPVGYVIVPFLLGSAYISLAIIGVIGFIQRHRTLRSKIFSTSLFLGAILRTVYWILRPMFDLNIIKLPKWLLMLADVPSFCFLSTYIVLLSFCVKMAHAKFSVSRDDSLDSNPESRPMQNPAQDPELKVQKRVVYPLAILLFLNVILFITLFVMFVVAFGAGQEALPKEYSKVVQPDIIIAGVVLGCAMYFIAAILFVVYGIRLVVKQYSGYNQDTVHLLRQFKLTSSAQPAVMWQVGYLSFLVTLCFVGRAIFILINVKDHFFSYEFYPTAAISFFLEVIPLYVTVYILRRAKKRNSPTSPAIRSTPASPKSITSPLHTPVF